MPEPRIVAGLSCGDVLARLSDFVDGELEPEIRVRLLEHLAGCNWCEEFGGRFSGIVRSLKGTAGARLEDDVAARLMDRLRDDIG